MAELDLDGVADLVLAAAQGDEQVEAYVERSRDTEVRVYEGEVEQLSAADSLGVGVRLLVDGRQGFAYCGTFEPEAVREAIADARDNAAFAEPDDEVALAEPDGVAPPELDLWRADLLEASTDRKVALAVELEQAVLAADNRVTGVESTDYGDSATEVLIASTTGLRHHARSTGCELVAYSLAEDGEATQTGFGFSVGRSLDDLDVSRAGLDAAERATRMLGAVKPPTGTVTVVLDPWVTAQFIGIVAGALSADEVIKGRSLFAGRVDEQVAATGLSLREDPTDERRWGAAPVDAEGLASRPVSLIDEGVLRGFVHSSWTGRRMGTGSTGSAVRNGYKSAPLASCRAVAPLPGAQGPAALLETIGDGVLVQEVSGLHSGVNPISGDLSTGAEGLRIRGGALAEPLREFTIASTLQRMLQDIAAVGSDLTWLPMSAAGSTLVIHGVSISGE